MSTTTYFRPSIHGWPFGNLWKYTFPFNTLSLEMGYCGGMCWTALQRFYDGIPIARGTPAPPQGDPLYDEIFAVQQGSLSSMKVGAIFEWQASPDLDKDGLGYRTQKEWPKVRGFLDASKPVTLTLIVHSNDVYPWHLSDNHRVVAYAYDVRPVDPAEGAPAGADSHVTLYIYDPNYPDEDDVCLTFFTGGKRSKIRLRHNRPDEEVHGFFVDDLDRSYASSDSTKVSIDKCDRTAITSKTRANYDLQFSWRCRFVPHFRIEVDDVDWKNLAPLQSSYEPEKKPNDFVNKQCPARTGSITANLELPRARSKVAVRLLDTDDYYQSVEVDAEPAILCYPYVQTRASGDGPQVCDTAIKDTDLFIKDPDPSQTTVQNLDDSPFRWIIMVRLPPRVIDTRGSADDLSRGYVEVIESYRLGNLVVPVYANFVERNLDPDTKTSGDVRTIKPGQTVHTTHLAPLASQAQKIFEGFAGHPDYNDGTRVELTYQSKENTTGLVVKGKATFYGKSIIYHSWTVKVHSFDPNKVAKLEAVARELVERGLIDIAIGLRTPTVPPHGPQPTPINPVALAAKLHSQPQLQGMIDQTLTALWGDPDMWKESWKAQTKLVKQAGKGRPIVIGKLAKAGDALKTIHELREAEQRKFDDVTVGIFVAKTIQKLRGNPDLTGLLTSL
jgi:hypothetical protein